MAVFGNWSDDTAITIFYDFLSFAPFLKNFLVYNPRMVTATPTKITIDIPTIASMSFSSFFIVIIEITA